MAPDEQLDVVSGESAGSNDAAATERRRIADLQAEESRAIGRRLRAAIVILGILIIAGFSIARLAVGSLEAKRTDTAQEFFREGQAQLIDGKPDRAIESFEDALSYDRGNDTFRLALAEALMRAGRTTEAKSHLNSLHDARPGNAVVNLELARLYARVGNLREALKFYQGAVNGDWDSEKNPRQRRVETQLEAASMLLNAGNRHDAHTMVMSAALDVPDDMALRERTADMLIDVGEPRQAYDLYGGDRRYRGRTTVGESVGLARAAYEMGDFERADRWITRAQQLKADDPQVLALNAKIDRVLNIDPFQPGIGAKERGQRIANAFSVASARLQQCQSHVVSNNGGDNGQGGEAALFLQNLLRWSQQLQPEIDPKKLATKSDLQETAMRFVFQSETAARSYCTLQPGPDDESLLALARQRWSAE